jgi:hypothetical protein
MQIKFPEKSQDKKLFGGNRNLCSSPKIKDHVETTHAI